MRIYIVEDDISVIQVLEDIIESQDLGEVCGDCGGEPADIMEVFHAAPDVVLVDFLMPVMDGVEFVRELRKRDSRIKCIMISQVSEKELIGKAYTAGIDFFISKPINLIEVRSVLRNVEQQIKNERTLNNIRRMFENEMPTVTEHTEDAGDAYRRKVRYVLNRIGISGEKGAPDIVRVCEYLHDNRLTVSQKSISRICEALDDSPKNMEQRIRRAIAAGMTNVAHMGIEDFMNETYTRYAGTLFSFEDVRAEMDHLRGRRPGGGKVSVKCFIDGLMLDVEQNG
ncbi:MAG: response regulator [Lachnospiraceae bacterium]|nr:response regulator [Lachnospiraceae bacterium]